MNYVWAIGLLSTLSHVAGATPPRHSTALPLRTDELESSEEGSTLELRADEHQEAQEGAGSCAGKEMSFEEFVQKFKRSYTPGSKKYKARQALFEKRVAEARAHNCMPGKRFWQAGSTPLSDWTVNELQKLRGRKGYYPGGQPSSGGAASLESLSKLDDGAPFNLVSVGDKGRVSTNPPALPDTFSWNDLESMKDVFDQGACGSCWASATAVMLRAHSDIYQQHRNFSVQQLVSCVPNPEACGGTGGCNGSTGELALDYVYHNGLQNEEEFPYQDGWSDDHDIVCPSHMVAKNKIPAQPQASSSFLAVSPAKSNEAMFASPAQSFGMVAWRRLPENKLEPLYDALYREGPVAVSIVSGYAWNAYVHGIMNDCYTTNPVVNHLVVLIGYGADDKLHGARYWHMQNSWGKDWGEQGHIRMIRQDSDAEEEAFCGMDDDPSVGTGCKGGPAQVNACGSCGILYDSVVAQFKGSSPRAQEMLSRRGN